MEIEKIKEIGKEKQILICTGTGCSSTGALSLIELLNSELEARGLDSQDMVVPTGCHGFCEQGPIVIIEPDNTFYTKVAPTDIQEIVERDIIKGEKIDRLFYRDPTSDEACVTYEKVNFYAKQKRIILGNCGQINPEKISHYLSRNGYKALEKVLNTMTPQEVIEEVQKAGLRGRGGAGFPTGLKWNLCRQSKGDKKYLICNADEGDPGAFMDRSILEGDPHAVIEGMLIGAYAIGADEGYIYCRAEYPLAIKRMQIAITQAEQNGILGTNILNSGFNFSLKIKAGAGAFVCGEETALIAYIEGKRGMPTVRPPYPAEKGLWGKPTNINNVETWANVPHILLKGASWYEQFGTDKSKGTKIFALTGKVNNTGLVEVPMGITLREVIFGIGGGIKNGKKYKAVQVGGPSGACLPESLLDLPIDYESLSSAGAMVGSGGLVVMDETTCMVDIARFFVNFSQKESCGKCTPCREGNKRMFDILDRITRGKGQIEDLEKLERLAQVIKDSSLCGLGQFAPNPVISTLKNFRDEFLAHILDKSCPAGVCTELLNYHIDKELCKRCGLCSKHCSVNAITGDKNTPYYIYTSICIKCGVCEEKCKFNAVIKM